MWQIAIWASLIGDEVKNVSEDLQRRVGGGEINRFVTISSPAPPPPQESKSERCATFVAACTHHTVGFLWCKNVYFQVVWQNHPVIYC